MGTAADARCDRMGPRPQTAAPGEAHMGRYNPLQGPWRANDSAVCQALPAVQDREATDGFIASKMRSGPGLPDASRPQGEMGPPSPGSARFSHREKVLGGR